MPPQPPPSIKDLVARTVADAQRLARAQMALLQTEMSSTGERIGKGGALGAVAALMAFFGVMFLLLTLAFVLVALGLPIWAGMLIVAVIVLIVATITALLAKREFDNAKPPKVALDELGRTKAALTGSPIAEAAPSLPPVTGS